MNKKHLELLDAGYTLVAASHRLARRLQYGYARVQIQLGRTAWPTPDILHWQGWLQRCWDRHAVEQTEKVLLNEWQERILWQRIIHRSDWADGLMQPANVAKRVMEAWNLLQEYCLPLFPSGVGLNEDARAFKGWAEEFAHACRSNDWCDGGSLIEHLTASIDTPISVALAGFERITPRQRQLIEAIEAAGGHVVVMDRDGADHKPAAVRVSAHADAGEELAAAANWARERLEANPDAGIGVVVPDLPSRRSEVIRRFGDALCPGGLVDPEAAGPPPFSLSLGKPLSEYALIDTAFSLLALPREALPLEDLGCLLRSPYLGGYEAEYLDRAGLEAQLRENGELRPSMDSVFNVAARRLPAERRPARFLDCLEAARQYLREQPRQASPAQWAEAVPRLLSLFGWPGDRPLASDEYQLLKAWRELLNRFVSVQLVESRLSYAEALRQLRRLAADSGFQPETAETPIQVLGLAGAADMGFDHLWVLGLHEEAWPPPARPNPFIPLALQRQHGLPGATAELALNDARQTLAQLVQSAREVVISYPQNQGDRALRPSPLLQTYGEPRDRLAAATEPDYMARVLAAGTLETLVDERAPPLAAGGHAAGGTALFKDQSACPFRAFARHRLHARTLEEADIGLSRRERGLIIHRLMQRLWQRLGSQERLNAMDRGTLERLQEEVIEATLAAARRGNPQIWTERFTRLERARLKSLLDQWLPQESRRAAFEVIACEEEHAIGIEGIQATTRIDRIDRLADGREVIIDYKTGEAKVTEWLGERPDDPQLPLYAVTREAPVAAIAFARLSRGRDLGYQGLAGDEGILPATKAFAASSQARRLVSETIPSPGWEDQLEDWKITIAGLARAFLEGDARVDPKNAQACRYCDQHAFCRIHERRAQEADDDD